MTRQEAMQVQAARSVCDQWKDMYKKQNVYVLKLEAKVASLSKELDARKTAMADKYAKVELRIDNGMTVSEFEALFDFNPDILPALEADEKLLAMLQSRPDGVVRNIARAVDEDDCDVKEALAMILWYCVNGVANMSACREANREDKKC